MESVVKNDSSFKYNFYYTFKEQIDLYVMQINIENRKKGTLPNTFHEASRLLIPTRLGQWGHAK